LQWEHFGNIKTEEKERSTCRTVFASRAHGHVERQSRAVGASGANFFATRGRGAVSARCTAGRNDGVGSAVVAARAQGGVYGPRGTIVALNWRKRHTHMHTDKGKPKSNSKLSFNCAGNIITKDVLCIVPRGMQGTQFRSTRAGTAPLSKFCTRISQSTVEKCRGRRHHNCWTTRRQQSSQPYKKCSS